MLSHSLSHTHSLTYSGCFSAAHQDSNILSFLNILVAEIFASFDEKSQQEIVYLLVVAIGNGNPAQKDTAIDTLTHLIKLHVKKVCSRLTYRVCFANDFSPAFMFNVL